MKMTLKGKRRLSLKILGTVCLASFPSVLGQNDIRPENPQAFPGGMTQSSVLSVLGQSPQKGEPKTNEPTKALGVNGYKSQAQRALANANGRVAMGTKPKTSPKSNKIPVDGEPPAGIIEENLIAANFELADAENARSPLPTQTELSEVPIAGFPSQAKESPPPTILLDSPSPLTSRPKKIKINVASGSENYLLSGSTLISPPNYLKSLGVILSLLLL